MNKMRLLLLLGLAGLLPLHPLAARNSTPPNSKSPQRTAAPTVKPGRDRKPTQRSAERAPESQRTEKPTTREERPAGRGGARNKSAAWDRRAQKTEAGRTKTSERSPNERDQRAPGGRGVNKASRWERTPAQTGRASKPGQRKQLLEHTFRGELKNGRASGFHYEGARIEAVYGTKVIEGTRTAPDAHGVYMARVAVRGVEKKWGTSFFPRSWSRTEVIKAIEEAYANRATVAGKAPNYFQGRSSSGVTVAMYFNKHGEMVTAFPIYTRGGH